MRWELDDSRSIYPQLKEHIKNGIIAGEYPPGSSFPTVRDLAQEAGVNRNTMQRAMAELESEGLLITNRTAGRTVTTDSELIENMRKQIAMQHTEIFLQEMTSLGYSMREALAAVEDKIKEKTQSSDSNNEGEFE